MRWKGRSRSTNVEDRRGQRMPLGGGRMGGGLRNVLLLGFMRGSPKMRIVMVIVAVLAVVFFRGSVFQMLGFSSGGATPYLQQSGGGLNDEMDAYLRTMMADNEKVWPELLANTNVPYRPCKMVIYSGRTMTPGGIADARTGPFYSPGDETIYIDPAFFRELKQKFGATGDFAEAYVVAHEYAHHIQHLMGRLKELHSARSSSSKTDYNQRSVRVELHADFLAGVFAQHAERTFGEFLEAGDIEEAIRAAKAIGDDRIQAEMGGGRVNPDLFTHGTSAQRARWFKKGITSGDVRLGEQIYNIAYGQL